MKPKAFYNLAYSLAHNGSGPEDFRSAISRAYYAVYNTADNVVCELVGKLDRPERQSYHLRMRDCLKCSHDQLIIQTGHQMWDMFQQRKDADYVMSDPVVDVENPKTAQAVVQQAKKLIERLETAMDNPGRRNRIQTALLNWKSSQ